MRTLEEIESMSKNILSPEDVCSYIGGDAHFFRNTARKDKKNHTDSFGFPVMVIGCRVKIPKEPFVKYMRGEQFEKAESKSNGAQ